MVSHPDSMPPDRASALVQLCWDAERLRAAAVEAGAARAADCLAEGRDALLRTTLLDEMVATAIGPAAFLALLSLRRSVRCEFAETANPTGTAVERGLEGAPLPAAGRGCYQRAVDAIRAALRGRDDGPVRPVRKQASATDLAGAAASAGDGRCA